VHRLNVVLEALGGRGDTKLAVGVCKDGITSDRYPADAGDISSRVFDMRLARRVHEGDRISYPDGVGIAAIARITDIDIVITCDGFTGTFTKGDVVVASSVEQERQSA